MQTGRQAGENNVRWFEVEFGVEVLGLLQHNARAYLYQIRVRRLQDIQKMLLVCLLWIHCKRSKVRLAVQWNPAYTVFSTVLPQC
jgi:hypothetical protein